MAIGDYQKTTWNVGGPPGISAPRLQKNEDKTDELDKGLMSHLADTTAHAGIPVGGVIFVSSVNAPTGFLKCNGAEVSRTAYVNLFNAIGTTFGVGDGVNTFKLPDLRGEFIRGFDDGRGIDTGRTLGSSQDEAFKSHGHTITSGGTTSSSNYGRVMRATNTSGDISISTDAAGGTETRPRNISLLACIRY